MTNQISVLNSQISNLTEQIANLTAANPEIRIINFSLIDGWYPVGGAECVHRFNLTVENYGQINVNGLVLKVKMFENGTDAKVWNSFNADMSPLGASETRVYSGYMTSDISVFDSNIIQTYEAVVMLNNSTLDEKPPN